MSKLAISIINFKTETLTEKCLKSILDKKWKSEIEIYVVDNDSKDGSLEYLEKKFPKVIFIKSDANLGFAGGHNLVLKKAKADFYLILNSDTEVMVESLDKLIEIMEEKDWGIASGMLLNSDGSFQAGGGDLPTLLAVFVWIAGLDDVLFPVREKLPSLHRKFKSYFKWEREIGWVGGTAMVIKRDVISKIGLLDERIFMYAEDVEYCLRARQAGFKVGFTPQAKIKHIGGASLDEPHFRQWLGEFKGLKYIYQKHFSALEQLVLNFLIIVFTLLRIIIFSILGKFSISKTYVKVLKNI
jgi:GT2 family glycosyltransferase